MLVLGGAGLIAHISNAFNVPIRGPNGITRFIYQDLNETWTRLSNDNWSALGPLGIVALALASLLASIAFARRRADARQLVLAASLPVFLVLMALTTSFNIYIVRFWILPAVVAAPLLARLFRDRLTSIAYVGVGALVVGLTIAHDQAKPLGNPYGLGRPWQLSQFNALVTDSRPDYAVSYTAYRALVPAHACVGAVLNGNEPSYFLYGTRFEHPVFYLPAGTALTAAVHDNLFDVVLSNPAFASDAASFKAAGWRIRPLGSIWVLASDPRSRTGLCAA